MDHAKKMKDVATVVAVGVGKLDEKELQLIASANDLVFTAQKFDELESITQTIADKTCEASITGNQDLCLHFWCL